MSHQNTSADGDNDEPIHFGDMLDQATFDQVLEMDDDDEERTFSKGLVFGFFEQAETTFDDMQAEIDRGDLAKLSNLGHFLKGSSATLGLLKLEDACERIQHCGANKDETGALDEPDNERCLDRIRQAFKEAKTEYAAVSRLLKRFYDEEE